ncbi:hypothetical protein HYX70_03950 [Candidatus Saccharibacteria bacterium]|nr:hypothetical protein [Candidatus Saccharibacteria bacterium]
MEGIKDILQRRSSSIGSNQLTAMEAIKKATLDITGVSARVVRLQHQTATLAVESSVAASEIRLHTAEIVLKTGQILCSDQQLKSIRVLIR